MTCEQKVFILQGGIGKLFPVLDFDEEFVWNFKNKFTMNHDIMVVN